MILMTNLSGLIGTLIVLKATEKIIPKMKTSYKAPSMFKKKKM